MPRAAWRTAATAWLAILVLAESGCRSAQSEQGPWDASYFPDVPLVTQAGKTVHLYRDLIKNRKVIVNFIYASCEQSCGLATARLAQVQRRLGDRIGRDVFIYSITVDPEHDTPAVLSRYAATFHARPGWLFLTGTRENIDIVRYKLGERTKNLAEGHNNEIRVGDGSRGQWMKLPLFDDLDAMLVEMDKWLGPDSMGVAESPSYAEAPRLAAPAPGQSLFQNRCAACHTVGRGDLIGPDLQGVTSRRDPAWLARFIAEPDRMLAEKDSLATALFVRYGRLPMPNLGLREHNVAALIDYLRVRSDSAIPLRGGESGAGE